MRAFCCAFVYVGMAIGYAHAATMGLHRRNAETCAGAESSN